MQYLIEEAVFERVAVMDVRDRVDSLPEAPGEDPMQRARDFAAGLG